MVKNSGQKLLIFVFLAMLACVVPAPPPLVKAQDDGSRQKLSAHYEKALAIIRENYVADIDSETLAKAAIQGMLKSLDPHSDYLDRKAYQEFNEKQHSQYFGIGSHIRQINRVTYIVEPFKNSPASRAGLRYGDHIIGVDGQDTSKWTSDRVRNLLLGDRGTQVTVTVARPGVREPVTATITRDGIWLPSIPNYYLVKPDVGYIGLTRNFQSTTSRELAAAMAELREKGAESFILDLRGNGGGYLDQAIKVCDQFLQRGQSVVTVRGRAGNDNNKSYVADTGASENFPLVVLIDRATASASEIVAGAVQDHDRGLIIGEPSFGKGLVQRIFPLNDGRDGALTLTIAHYYTPSGRLIQRDYSNGSLFEYYYRRSADGDTSNTTKNRTDEKKTDLGRPVYGGGGIDPDIQVDSGDTANSAQNRLIHGLCLFVRELISGQIPNYAQFKLNGITYDYKVKGNEFIIPDDLMKVYRQHVIKFYKDNPEYGATVAMIDENMAWARKQIRQEVLLAFYGADKAQQAMADSDVQLQRAVSEMPQAADLANRSWRRGTTSMRRQ